MPQNKLWTVGSCLSWTRDYLDRKGDDHARLSAEWLLCAATDKDRTRLYMDYDQPLSPDELSLMHGYIERRAAGEPLQYITGRTTFRFVEVACEPGVLIPRPKTEILVDAALEGVDACPDDEPLVLEVGTGTGCVAASIASERKAARVVATDLSPVAAGLWRQRELYDGTYTFSDLADSHELMQVQAENARRAVEAGRDANG